MPKTTNVFKKVLVVDDYEAHRERIIRVLKSCGYLKGNDIVVEAEDGEKAVEIARTEIFSLITMDLCMERMDGDKAIEIIRKFDTKTPIVVITLWCGDESRVIAETCGAICAIEKDRVEFTLPEFLEQYGFLNPSGA